MPVSDGQFAQCVLVIGWCYFWSSLGGAFGRRWWCFWLSFGGAFGRRLVVLLVVVWWCFTLFGGAFGCSLVDQKL
ncbi:hypothetical protein C2G38_2186018 [Gigaspora rosea]|uniref:Transmembrane protein n=1 Tax=Gigaspora rosea TaxID=44941 RepID=A0A397V9E3_9GLOM|nr:hypothetical protein C2G38_2186018 [Gigaspora rosea]